MHLNKGSFKIKRISGFIETRGPFQDHSCQIALNIAYPYCNPIFNYFFQIKKKNKNVVSNFNGRMAYGDNAKPSIIC